MVGGLSVIVWFKNRWPCQSPQGHGLFYTPEFMEESTDVVTLFEFLQELQIAILIACAIILIAILIGIYYGIKYNK